MQGAAKTVDRVAEIEPREREEQRGASWRSVKVVAGGDADGGRAKGKRRRRKEALLFAVLGERRRERCSEGGGCLSKAASS
jgi:hypothetical protein